jgi:hypothetical protein
MKRVLGGVGAALAGLVVVAMVASAASPWGCATSETKPRPTSPQGARNDEPDGGWQNYRPPRRDYEPDPNRSSAQDPISAPIVPVTPGSPTVSPTVH